MDRTHLTQQFSCRLKEAMMAAGHRSGRSSSGVDVHKLAEITGYSAQICRKYLQGRVIPEPTKLSEIAEKLGVSPGWLLFGDSHGQVPLAENKITISKHLLHYIFTHANQLYLADHAPEEIPDFLLGLTSNLSQIDASDEQSKKIIDLTLFSIQHFRP